MCLLSVQATKKDLDNKKAQIDELAALNERERNEWKKVSTKEREQMEKAHVLSSVYRQALQLQLANAQKNQRNGLASFEILEEQTRLNMELESRLSQQQEDLKESVVLRNEVKLSFHCLEISSTCRHHRTCGDNIQDKLNASLLFSTSKYVPYTQAKKREDAYAQDIQQLQSSLRG